MADQLGGGAAAGDPKTIYNQAEPVVAASEAMNWARGLQTGQGQAQGGAVRATPGRIISHPTARFTPGLLGMKYTPGEVDPGAPNKYQTLNDAISQIHNFSQETLTQYTQRLYAAGLYPDKSYAKGAKPPSGRVVTDEDVTATTNLIATAQRYIQIDRDQSGNVTGQRIIKTIDEIINEFTAAGEGDRKLKAATQKQGQVYTVTISDPADIRAQVTRIGQAILGRALSDSEQAALVDQMLAAERSPQEAAIQAGQASDNGGDVRLATARVDTEARLQEKIKAQNPNEAAAYSEMNYVNIMREMIGGGNAS